MNTKNKTQNTEQNITEEYKPEQNSNTKVSKWLTGAAVAGAITLGSILGVQSCNTQEEIMQKPKPTLCELTAKIQSENYKAPTLVDFEEKDIYAGEPKEHPKAFGKHPVKNGVDNESLEIYFPVKGYAFEGNDLEDLSNYLKSIDSTQDDLTLLIEGRADKRGSDELNQFYGDKRVKSTETTIKTYLPKNLNNMNIQTIVYGENKPLKGSTESEELQRNRSSKLTVTSNPIQNSVNILGGDVYLVDLTKSMEQELKSNGTKTKQDYVNEVEFPLIPGKKIEYTPLDQLDYEASPEEIAEAKEKIAEAKEAMKGTNPNVFGIKESRYVCGGNLTDQIAEGKSPIYDKLMDVMETMEDGKTITILTDGYDNNSSHNINEVISYANQKNIHVNLLNISAQKDENIEDLLTVTNKTGGKYILYK